MAFFHEGGDLFNGFVRDFIVLFTFNLPLSGHCLEHKELEVVIIKLSVILNFRSSREQWQDDVVMVFCLTWEVCNTHVVVLLQFGIEVTGSWV